ncbi:hypothetical protein FBU30_010673 [Linnemannia zychae]|nr:hypothetical protein FBU30_010673 [Linnemannia zychae]
MFEHADYVQPFSYNGIVRKLEVIRPVPGTSINGEVRDFVLLEDVLDHFSILSPSDVFFERQDGVSLSFTRDKNLRRHVPERIPACQGTIIYVIPTISNSKSTAATTLPPVSSSSTSSHRAPATTSSTLPTDVTPRLESSSEASTVKSRSRFRQSLIINIPETHNPHEPMSQSNLRTVQDSNFVVKSNKDYNNTRDKNDKKDTALEGKEEFNAELDEQQQNIRESVRQEAESAVIDVLQRYKAILVRLALILAKAEEILSTPVDFEQGNGPRFFIILPSHDHKWDNTNILLNHFRLFFLCECGTHTPVFGQGRDDLASPCLHLADQEGFRVRDPVNFIAKFGPYLMVMLEMLKFSNEISGYVLPGLSDTGEIFPADTFPPTSLTLERINKSIAYIEMVACLNTLRPWDYTEYLENVKATDGFIPRNQFLTFLEMDKSKTRFSRMYRIKTMPGRADWLCQKHQPTALKRQGNYNEFEFESTLSSVGACLDYQRGKITVTMTSSLHGEKIFSILSGAPGAKHYDLELALDSIYTSADMKKLQKLAKCSIVRSVIVAAPTSVPLPAPTNVAVTPDQDNSHSDYASVSSRSSSRSDSVSSDQPMLASSDKKLPDWVYTFYDQQPKHQYDDGRTRHTVESSPYMLPNDLTEIDRLDAQHYIVRYIFQGNCSVKLDRNAPLKILDVATGTGVWVLEMAQEFPNAEIHGVDLSPIYPSPETSTKFIPPNCHFQLCNVLDGLPFPDNYFDFVHQRLLVYAFTPTQRRQVNIELLRVLKPSGYIQLIESDGLVYNSGPKTDMVNTLSLNTPRRKSVDPTEVQRLKPGLKYAGFTNINSFCIALPVGDWGGLLGQLSRQNMHGLATIWLRGELGRQTVEMCEATLAEMDKECEQFQSFYRVWLVVGQKPLLTTIMPSPPQSFRKESLKSSQREY